MSHFRIALLTLMLTPLPVALAEEQTGKQIYQAQCVRCHGENGEGDPKRYPEPLVGDRSVAQLTKLIHTTMPEQKPSQCVDDDARKVAAFIHDAFYSPEAQARIRPPRIELTRLTVPQYRNAVADLISSLKNASPNYPTDKNGLRGEYFRSRRYRPNERGVDRIDSTIELDFGEESPDPGKMPAEEFAARWSGSVIAPETGLYTFVLRSQNGARLWVNDSEPLIDAFVKSGDDDRTGSIFLLGGRAYPLRLEFFKSAKAKEKTAAITLAWEPPHGVREPIPSRNLIPTRVESSFVLTTAFPPDDRSYGWVRGSTISKEWDAATTDAAIETLNYLFDTQVNKIQAKNDAEKAERYQQLGAKFAQQAFRRPLTEDERRLYVDRQFEQADDPEIGLKRCVLLTLKSPRFLYRELAEDADGYAVASRLSFGLWDSIPDEELLRAAAEDRLQTPEQVRQQAKRMLADTRAKTKIREFLHSWLKLDHGLDPAKDSERFPDFGPDILADLRTSLDLFLDEVVWGNGDFRQFFRGEEVYLNGRLARFFGVDLPEDASFQKIALTGEKRAGVLTHPFLMTNFSYTTETSPIHRGVFIARGILGVGLKPPQEAFTPFPADLHPDLTTRERVALQTKSVNCQACHGIINPLGFPLENFDAVGRFRAKENGKPIDASGSFEKADGHLQRFDDPQEMAEFLARSNAVHASFVEQLFHHLVKQPMRAYGPNTKDELRDFFSTNGFNTQTLIVEIMAETALRPRSLTSHHPHDR